MPAATPTYWQVSKLPLEDCQAVQRQAGAGNNNRSGYRGVRRVRERFLEWVLAGRVAGRVGVGFLLLEPAVRSQSIQPARPAPAAAVGQVGCGDQGPSAIHKALAWHL